MDTKKNLIEVSGTYFIILIIMASFFSKYALEAMKSYSPSIVHNFNYIQMYVISSALPAGIFIGRLLYYTYRLKKGPHTDL